MEEKKQKLDTEVMHHPEHMCSLRLSSCRSVSRAQMAEAEALEGKKEVSGKAPDICTPFVGGA